MHARTTRPIMRTVQSAASLHDATVVLDDRVILRAVSVAIDPGLTLVRGPNGSGKTTLLRVLAGLVPLARGDRRVADGVLYIGHRPMLLRGLTARENLEFFVRFRGGDTRGIDGALRAWGVGEDMDRPVERLSAGERRRAALARVETERVPLLLLDEPFADLDDAGVTRLRQAITRARDDGRAIVVATHAHRELDELARAQIAVDDALEGLVALPGGRDALFGGKVLSLTIVLLLVAAIGGLLSLVLLDLPVALPLHLIVVVLLGVLALPPIVVVDVVLALRLRARAALVPILALPVLVPQLVAATRGTSAALSGDAVGALSWAGLLFAFAVVYTVIGLTIVPAAIE